MGAQKKSAAPASEESVQRHALSPAYLALLPMFLCYELGVRDLGGSQRNAAQVLLSLWLEPFGVHADGIRWGLLAAFGVVALYLCRAHGIRIRDAVARIWLEGLLVALILGPVLVGLTALALRGAEPLDISWDASRASPGLAVAGYFFGGAVYEELVFRIGVYGVLFWTGARVARELGGGESTARWAAEGFGLLGSSLGFAAFHFQRFTHWLWGGGLDYSTALFTWLTLAGLLLGLIFRLRGPGVAAVAHGLFNLGLLVGIDPDVLT